MTATATPAATGSKSWIAALLLCFFVGSFGVHRFYVGKVGTGILMLVTFGGLGVWTLIDFIMIAIGKFSDKQGNALAR
jgi:TM2 domain-containing membrane protein YozV